MVRIGAREYTQQLVFLTSVEGECLWQQAWRQCLTASCEAWSPLAGIAYTGRPYCDQIRLMGGWGCVLIQALLAAVPRFSLVRHDDQSHS